MRSFNSNVKSSTSDESNKALDIKYHKGLLNSQVYRPSLEANYYPDQHLMQIPTTYQMLPTYDYVDGTHNNNGRRVNCFVLDSHISRDYYKQIKSSVPNLVICYDHSSNMKVTPHTDLRAERAIGEELMMGSKFSHRRRNRFNIYDVGGNPNRHRHQRRNNVWCYCPRISARDIARADSLCDRNKCECRVQANCQHWTECKTEDPQNPNGAVKCNQAGCLLKHRMGSTNLIMMTHSIYYFYPRDIAQMMLDRDVKTAYSLHHRFEKNFGKLSEAARYEVQGDYVTMEVQGESPFYHDNIRWLNDREWTYNIGGQQYGLIYTVSHKLPYSEIGKFELIVRNDNDNGPMLPPSIFDKVDQLIADDEKKKEEIAWLTNLDTNFALWKNSKYTRQSKMTRLMGDFKMMNFKHLNIAYATDTIEERFKMHEGGVPLIDKIKHNKIITGHNEMNVIFNGDLFVGLTDKLNNMYNVILNQYRLFNVNNDLLKTTITAMTNYAKFNSDEDWMDRVQYLQSITRGVQPMLFAILIAVVIALSFLVVYIHRVYVYVAYSCAVLSLIIYYWIMFIRQSLKTNTVRRIKQCCHVGIIAMIAAVWTELLVTFESNWQLNWVISVVCLLLMGHQSVMIYQLSVVGLAHVCYSQSVIRYEYSIGYEPTALWVLVFIISLIMFYKRLRSSRMPEPLTIWKKCINAQNKFVRGSVEIVGLCYGGILGTFKQVGRSKITTNYKSDFCNEHRVMGWLYGPAIGVPVLTSKCPCNAIKSLNHRALRERPLKPNSQRMKHFKKWCFKNMNNIFGPPDKLTLPDREDWLASIKQPGKRKLMEQGLEEMFHDMTLKHGFKHSHKIKAFMKMETLMQNEIKPARLIQGRSPQFNAQWGNFAKAVSARIKYNWTWLPPEKIMNLDYNNDFHRSILEELNSKVRNWVPFMTYASGYTPDKIGQWFDKALDYAKLFDHDVVFIETDFSKYDMSQNNTMEEIVLAVMCHLVCVDQPVLEALKTVARTEGTMQGFDIKFFLDPIWHMRKSGDQHTSVGNSILTGLMFMYVACCVLKCEFSQLGQHPLMSTVLGDDTATVTTRKLAKVIVRESAIIYKEMGISTKTFIKELHEGTFCSSYFVPCCDSSGNRTHVLTKKIGRVLGKTFYSTKQLGPKKQKGYARGIAEGLKHDYGHIPFMNMMMDSIIWHNRHYKVWKKKRRSEYDEWKHVSQAIYPSIETYEWFEKMYGISSDDLEELEVWLASNYDGGVGQIDHAVLHQIFRIDNGYGLAEVNDYIRTMYGL
jgi:hypothetical protein